MTTAETKAPEGSRPFVDYETVDGDGHTVLGSYDWWKPYLPKKYWEWAPQPIREPNQEGNVLCEGRVYRLPMPYPGSKDKSSLGGLMTPGGWKLDDLSAISVEEGRKAGGADPHDRLKAMDADQVSIAYLYPSEMLSLPWALLSSSFAMALARAYNDWLIDYRATDPHRLRGAAVIPQQDLILALEEIERVRKLGMATIMLRPNLIGGITFEHPNYEPIWAACQDMDMGIGVHEGFGVEMPTIGWDRTHNWMQAHALQHPAEHMAATQALDHRRRLPALSQAAHGLPGKRRGLGSLLAPPHGRALREVAPVLPRPRRKAELLLRAPVLPRRRARLRAHSAPCRQRPRPHPRLLDGLPALRRDLPRIGGSDGEPGRHDAGAQAAGSCATTRSGSTARRASAELGRLQDAPLQETGDLVAGHAEDALQHLVVVLPHQRRSPARPARRLGK